MYEVEAKIWIKNEQAWMKLKAHMKQNAVFKCQENKNDLYFGKSADAPPLFRLREFQDQKLEVTIKVKKIVQGVEETEEHSFQINDKASFLFFCEKTGYKIVFQKNKKSLIFQKGNLSLELNTLDGLGYFLEIEKIVEKQSKIPRARAQILQYFATLGYSEKDLESKPYYLLYKDNY